MALNSSNFSLLVATTLDAKNIQKQLDLIAQRYGTIRINLDVNTNQLNQATNSLSELRTNLHDTSSAAQNTSQSLGDIITKVTKFGGATLVINKFREAIVDGYGAVKELDASVTEYRKVSDLTDNQMVGFIDNARELGLTVSRTTDEMIEAATEFKKMGNDDSTALQLGQLASMFQNVADEAISAGDSANFINSQMKAFNFTASKAIHIIDAVNEVANNFAVSSGDISTALPKVASTLALAGNSFEETIGLLTAGAEIIPNQSSRIARGLRSVTLNLQGLNEDGEAVAGMVANMEEDFNKLGLTLMDSEGQIKSTYEIFSDLAEVFPKLDKNTQTYYASLIGGKTQVDIVTAILKNFDTALNATDAALNSTGSALKENEKYLDSIQGRISALTTEFEKFWTEGISSNTVKNIVSMGTATLKLINNLGGLPTILVAITGTLVTLKGYKIFENVQSGIGTIRQFITALKQTKAEGYSTTEALIAMGNAERFVTAGLGLATIALTAIVGAVSAYKNHQEELTRTALSAGETYKTQADELNNLRNRINEIYSSEDDEATKAAQLKEIREELATTYHTEKDKLDELNKSREAGIGLIDEEALKLANTDYAKYADEIKKAEKYLTSNIKINFGDFLSFENTDEELYNKLSSVFAKVKTETGGMINSLSGTPELLKEGLEEAIVYMEKIQEPTAREEEILRRLRDELKHISTTYDESTQMINAHAVAIVTVNDDYQKFISGTYDSKEAFEAQLKAVKDSFPPLSAERDIIEQLAYMYFPDFKEAVKESNEEQQRQGDTAKETAEKLKTLTSQLSECQTAYDTLTKAAKEYNDTGSINVETLSKLLQLNPEFYEALEIQNGKMVVNTELLNAMAQEYGITAIQLVTAAGSVDTFTSSVDGSATASTNASPKYKSAGEAAAEAGKKAAEGAKGFAVLTGAIAGAQAGIAQMIDNERKSTAALKGEDWMAFRKQRELEEKLKAIASNIQIDTSTKSKGGGKSSKDNAEKAAKEAAKAYKEEFEKRISEIKFKFDMGDVTELGYWKEVEKIVQEFYGNNEAYAEEYRDWIVKIQDGMVAGTQANYDLERDALEHKLAMDLISEEEFYKELEKLRQEYYAQDPIYAAQSEAIEEEIYAFKKKKLDDLAAERKKRRKEEFDEETDWLNEQKSRYETAFNYIDSLAQKEIDKLEEQKQAIEDKYQAEIDKINEANDALDDEIELQEKLEALAKAKNTRIRIYREGQGFVYETDQSAVDEAKAALTQYQKEQDTKKEIKRLEELRDATIQSVEEQIKYWNTYRDKWKDMVNAYTESQNKLIAEQVLGTSLEGDNWEKRLDNLQDYVDRYNSILSQLKNRKYYYDDDDEYWDDEDYDYGGGSGTAGGGGTIGPDDHAGSGGHWDSSDSSHGPGAAANGVINGRGLTMVGEKGRELRILGNGSSTGDGIIPNHLTENLMKLGQFSPRQWINALSGQRNESSMVQYNYAFDKLELPNVRDANGLIEGLKSIRNQAIQMGGRRY